MKIIVRLLLVSVLMGIGLVTVAEKKKVKEKYHRSSLHTIFIEMDKDTEDGMNKDAIVLEAYDSMPFPDKYNEHRISENSIDPSSIEITEADRVKPKSKFGKIGNFLKSKIDMKGDIVPDLDGESAADLKLKVDKYLKEHRVANELVAKWFNRKGDGSFDMELIKERGAYDANALDIKVAQGSERGVAVLQDAGEELIQNTFIVVTRMKYVKNEVIANAIKIAALKLPGALQAAALLAADGFLKEGYSVWTKSFLYKLKWDKEIGDEFYSKYWISEGTKNAQDRKKAFENSDLFQMEYIGKKSAITMITETIGEVLGTTKKEVRNVDDLVKESAIRTIDKVYAKLQKKYDVFKPRVPLLSGSPITAKIGMKEGLKGGEKFEVLEQKLDAKTGKIKYVKKGRIKVSKEKGKVWDNRYSLDAKNFDKEGVTYFEGKGKYYPGMLIRQVK